MLNCLYVKTLWVSALFSDVQEPFALLYVILISLRSFFLSWCPLFIANSCVCRRFNWYSSFDVILKTFFRSLCLLAMSDNPTENQRNLVCAVSILSVSLTRHVWEPKNRPAAKNPGTEYKACHCTLSGAAWVQSTSCPICLRLYLLICIIYLFICIILVRQGSRSLSLSLSLSLCRKL